MCPKSFGGVRFDLGFLLQGRMWYLIPMMDYISPIIVCRGCGCADVSSLKIVVEKVDICKRHWLGDVGMQYHGVTFV